MESGYAFDGDRFCLGSLCKRGHDWRSTGQSLRRRESNKSAGGNCLECEQVRLLGNPTALAARREYAREYMRKHRAECGRLSRSKRALPGESKDVAAARLAAERAICEAIRAAGRSPSVARLVMNEQLRHWREHPSDRAAHDRRWAQASWWLEYQINPDMRLYHREKSKRRKAQNRGQTPVQIPVAALRQRFNEFGNCCAYCGTDGDMQIEHVEPISEGGAHDIGNIVPACGPCNTSKRTSDMENWYRSQPFFSELRLHQIRRAIRSPEGEQLALALA